MNLKKFMFKLVLKKELDHGDCRNLTNQITEKNKQIELLGTVRLLVVYPFLPKLFI